VTIGQMASYLFVWRIDDGHLAFHESLQRRIAKSSCKSEYMIYPFFMKGAGE
jgi:hypothetical protein